MLGQQRGWARRLLEYEDEVLALCCMLWDVQSLQHHGGTFAESLYGMRREARSSRCGGRAESGAGASTSGQHAAAAAAAATALGSAPDGSPAVGLTSGQIRLALLMEVRVRTAAYR